MADGEHPNPNVVEKHQLCEIRTLLATLIPDNPFYSEKLRDIDPNLQSLAEFSARVPFTYRHELVEDQRVNPPYGTNLTYPLEHYTRMHQTSGTTDIPMRWLDTTESWNWMLGNWARVYEVAGVGRGDTVFFPFSFGPFLGFWAGFESAALLGCLCISGGGLRSTDRLRAMIDSHATVLCCTPTYAVHLTQVAARETIPIRKNCPLRAIIVAGEPGAAIPSTRRLIEESWGQVRVVDHHGMTEIGPVSYECPSRVGVLHVMESAFYPEVVDQNGQRIDKGETGELVLTNLGRLGSPLLRYRTGDLVKPERPGPCQCGSHELALVGGILGRTDDMAIVRGVNVFPSAVEQIVRGIAGVAEYRVEICAIDTQTQLSISVEPTPGCTDRSALAQQVHTALRSALSLRIPVSVVAEDSLPRFEMKAARWVRT